MLREEGENLFIYCFREIAVKIRLELNTCTIYHSDECRHRIESMTLNNGRFLDTRSFFIIAGM